MIGMGRDHLSEVNRLAEVVQAYRELVLAERATLEYFVRGEVGLGLARIHTAEEKLRQLGETPP